MRDSTVNAHWITNFPPSYPLHKKIIANLIYFLTGIVIHPRKNLLNHQDLLQARIKLRRGDIVLLGNLRETSAYFIQGAVTHAAFYLGRRLFIHAAGDGVTYVSLHRIFTDYDTMALLRLPSSVAERKTIINQALAYAQGQLGRPYDFEFTKGLGKIFCTELINESFKHAGHDTCLKTFQPAKSFEERILKLITRASLALRPEKFLESNFELVFLSHNLRLKKKLVLKWH